MKIRISIKKLNKAKGCLTVNTDLLNVKLDENANNSLIQVVSEALIRKNESLIAVNSETISEVSTENLEKISEEVLLKNKRDGEPLTIKRRLGK